MAAHATDAGAPHSVSAQLDDYIAKLEAVAVVALEAATTVEEERTLPALLNCARNAYSKLADIAIAREQAVVAGRLSDELERARKQGEGFAVPSGSGPAAGDAAGPGPN